MRAALRTAVCAALCAFAAAASAGDEKKPAKPGGKEGPAAPQNPPKPPPLPSNKTGETDIDDATEAYEKALGFPLRVSMKGRFIVRGDSEQEQLDKVADACDRTLKHFVSGVLAGTGGVEDDVFTKRAAGETGVRGGPVRVEVFQFVREKAYLTLLDKVIARIRDDTVDDRRLALMRRQRGFFIQSPRLLMAHYQGPGEFESCISQSSHKTSHMALLAWRRAGGWQPWWLLEGVASWQELKIFKECRTYCIEVADPGGYEKAGTPEADEASKAKMEDAWREKVRAMIREKRNTDLGVLARRALNEISYDDVIQSWSFTDWLAQTGKLPAFLAASKEKRDLDATCREALGMPAAGAEQAWIEWAK